MGLPTADEVWGLALPPGTQLAAGASGLGASVQWAHRMSVYPPVFSSLEESEIALLSVDALALVGEQIMLCQLTESLAQRGVAALGVVGPVSEEAKAVADLQGVPLFRLPDGSDLRDTERDIIRLIVEREAQLERRGQQVYQQLAKLSIEDKGLSGIAEELLKITGKAIVIQDDHMSILAVAWPERETVTFESLAGVLTDADLLRAHLSGSGLPNDAPDHASFRIDLCGWVGYVSVITIEGKPAGYLSLLAPDGGVNDLDRLSVRNGALVCAVELAKQRAVEAANYRFQGELLDLILTAGPSEEEAVSRRALDADYDLEGTHVATLIVLPGDAAGLLVDVIGRFQGALLNTGIRAFLGVYGDQLVVLCSADAPDAVKQIERLARMVRDDLVRSVPDVRLAAGIGRPGRGLAGLRRSFNQAREALVLAKTMFAGDRVLSFGDLGVFRLLGRLCSSEELDEFYSQTLRPLVEYDASHGTELVLTLEAYFAHRGNATQTAKSLYLRRNSLSYPARSRAWT